MNWVFGRYWAIVFPTYPSPKPARPWSKSPSLPQLRMKVSLRNGSLPRPNSKLYTEGEILFSDLEKAKTISARTEQSGLLPISKYVAKPTSGNFEANPEAYTVASTTISVDVDKTKLFSFDYSDKIILYLNGAPIFYGNNAFRSKNNQFQGHLGLGANKIQLHLEKGSNTLHCVVIDKANGWGLIGKLE